MAQYKHRTSTVEAFRWFSGQPWLQGMKNMQYLERKPQSSGFTTGPAVLTPKGWKVVKSGDWIITEPNGAQLVLDHEDFTELYEQV